MDRWNIALLFRGAIDLYVSICLYVCEQCQWGKVDIYFGRQVSLNPILRTCEPEYFSASVVQK